MQANPSRNCADLLLPLTYLAHIAEELWGGVSFPVWVSRLWGIDFSRADFITLNAIAFTVMLLGVMASRASDTLRWVIVPLACAVTINGALHLVASVVTWSYSPGLVSGVLLWIPLGTHLLRHARSALPARQFVLGLAAGVAAHGLVSFVAFFK